MDVFLGFGSNLGDREQNLRRALQLTEEAIGPCTRCSSFLKNAPWGFCSTEMFLNAAACFETELQPEEVLHRTQEIERQMGRTEKSNGKGYADRVIDIDLLLYGQQIVQTKELTIPHPLMRERLFVLAPLDEIASERVHPVYNKTVHQLYEELLGNEKEPKK